MSGELLVEIRGDRVVLSEVIGSPDDPNERISISLHKSDWQRFIAVTEAAFGIKARRAPARPTGSDERFDEFWAAYPKKIAREVARRSWTAVNASVDADEIIAAVEAAAQSPDWLKEGGKYVPYPATYLNQRRWVDVGRNLADDLGNVI